jgi:hypothetical protein
MTPKEIVISLKNTKITSHQGKMFNKANEIKLEATNSLSAKGSKKEPKELNQLKCLATHPSKVSVNPAIKKMKKAAAYLF